MDGAGDRGQNKLANINPKLNPGAPAGLKTGARQNRPHVLKPAGAPGPHFWLLVG